MQITETFASLLEIPEDIAVNLPKVVLLGEKRVYVSNYTALLEYKRNNIKLKHKTGVIEILGDNLEIKAVEEESITLSGQISTVRLI